MWFKNLQIYQFSNEFNFDLEDITANLQKSIFKPCAKILPMSSGWIPPLGDTADAPLIHSANGLWLLCLKTEEKILPTTVIRDHLAEKIIQLETKQQRKLSNKEKLRLKDDVYSTLLPQAFSKTAQILALIDPKNYQLVLDTSSRTKAEDFITFLRKTLGSLPVNLLETVKPSRLMTKWLKSQKMPRHFNLGESCLLTDSKLTSSTIKCNNQDLLSRNVLAFINDGMEVSQLLLSWKQQLEFTLRADFSVTQIKYADTVQKLAADIHVENETEEIAANFFIMSQTIREFVQDLLPLFQKH